MLPRLTRSVLVMGMTALLLAGCGGGDDQDGVSGDDTVAVPDTGSEPDEDVPIVPGEDTVTPPVDVPEGVDVPLPDEDVPVGSCTDPCDDGDPCTEGDECVDGACTGTPMACDDDNPCTIDACEDGACVHAPATGACDDDDACTDDDTCAEGACRGTPLDCDDENACTIDSCDVAIAGCVNQPRVGETCDDASLCTLDDRCTAEGACAGTPKDCGDGVGCTADTCQPDGSCTHEPAKEACDDGNPCTAEYCDETADCQRAGAFAATPTVDGDLSDWYPGALVAENNFVPSTPGLSLRSLSIEVGTDGLYMALKGQVGDGQAWLVFIDLDYLAETGVRDLATVGGSSPLDQAASLPLVLGAPGFGAEFLVGGVGPVGNDPETDAVGCRDLRNAEAPAAVECTIRVDAAAKIIEVGIPWTSLVGGTPSEDPTRSAALIGLAVDGDSPSNQFLPQQASPPSTAYFFAFAGGACFEPSCGNGFAEPGEDCDDGNDDPTDECVNCTFPPPDDITVVIPSGPFVMGRTSDLLDDPAAPPHEVVLDAFYLDKYEVTNEEYAAFLTENGSEYDAEGTLLYECVNQHAKIDCRPGGVFAPRAIEGYENHPVAAVLWKGAHDYCEAVGKRLPTEAEWEKAARGPEGWFWPWGSEFEPTSLNCNERVCADGFEETAPIGSFEDGVTYYGAYDMAGNVWEWTNDWYQADYYQVSPDENPRGPCNGDFVCSTATTRIARGGSWDDGQELTRSTYRYATSPGCISDIGLRCAADIPR